MPSGLEPRRTPVSNSKLKYESLDTNESIAAGDFPTAKKQKQEGVDNRVEPKARHTFKGIGNLVLAMKRFQGR